MPFILFALALLAFSTTPAGRIERRRRPRNFKIIAIVGAPLLLGLLTFIDHGNVVICGVIAACTALYILDRNIKARSDAREQTVIAHFLGHMLADIRAGATPTHAAAQALEEISDTASPELHSTLRTVGNHLHHGASGAEALRDAASPHLRGLGAVWALSDEHGVPMARLIEKARDGIDATQRRSSHVQAALTGPKTTATVLAALPVAGIGMGGMMGARPLHFLTTTDLGGVLLLIGTLLTCAGIIVSATIIEKATA